MQDKLLILNNRRRFEYEKILQTHFIYPDTDIMYSTTSCSISVYRTYSIFRYVYDCKSSDLGEHHLSKRR